MKTAGEIEIIERIKRWLPRPGSDVEVGIGDDCAVVFSGALRSLLTIDMLVEGVHFDRSYFSASELGHKALAVNLSDIAAMAGVPKQALVSMALPSWVDGKFLEEFFQGMIGLAGNFDVSVVGGNISATPANSPLVIDVCLRGEVETRPVLRKGAQPGDLLAVTGTLGASAAGLQALKKWGRGAMERFPDCCRAQLMPMPKVQEARALSQSFGVTAGIDVSDGISSDLTRLARASHCGFRIYENALPISKGTKSVAKELDLSTIDLALNGGEDYEWLFTLPKANASQTEGWGITIIGEAIHAESAQDPQILLVNEEGIERAIESGGWDHLK